MLRFYLINKGEVYAFVHVNSYVFNINTFCMLQGILSISVMANVQRQYTSLSAVQSSRSCCFTVPSSTLPIYKQNQKPNQPSLTHCN